MSTDPSRVGANATRKRKPPNTTCKNDQESAIIDAAIDEITHVGLNNASLYAIADAAGVSRSTVYRRFSDKTHLTRAVIDRVFDEGLSVVESTMTRLPPSEAVTEAYVAGANLIDTHPLLHRLVIADREIRGITYTAVTSMFVESLTARLVRILRVAGARRPEPDLSEAVEIIVRVAISHLEVPLSEARRNPAVVRGIARTHLAPMVW